MNNLNAPVAPELRSLAITEFAMKAATAAYAVASQNNLGEAEEDWNEMAAEMVKLLQSNLSEYLRSTPSQDELVFAEITFLNEFSRLRAK